MRKITEIQTAPYGARIYFDCEWREFRVKFYRNGEHMACADYFTDDESDARATAAMCIQHMIDAAARYEKDVADELADDARTDSETEELNIRLAREFNWGESVGFDNGSQ